MAARRQLIEDEEPRSLITRLFNSALALPIVVNVAHNLSANVDEVIDVTGRVRMKSEHGRGLTKQFGVCPHCGGVIFASLPHDEAGNASVSA